MKNIYISLLLLLFGSRLHATDSTKIRFDFNETDQPVTISYNNQTLTINPNKKKKQFINLMLKKPDYIEIMRTNIPELLYLYPGESVEVGIVGNATGHLQYTGDHSDIANWLLNPQNVQMGGDFSLSEPEFLKFLEHKVDTISTKLNHLKLTEDFVNKEKLRIQSRIYQSLVSYPSIRKRTEKQYKPSEAYYRFIEEVLFEKAEMLHLKDYTNFIQFMHNMLATRNIEKYDPLIYSIASINHVVKNVKDREIKEHLVNYFAYDYLKRNGIENIGTIDQLFTEHVSNDIWVSRYNKTKEVWKKVAKGSKIGDYTFYTAKGKEVKFENFIGKYIYIDMWATWCKPCIAEVPSLNKMADDLKGRNIEFISISTDKDREAWQKMIKKQNEKFLGNQWHARDRIFSADLMIVSIPRFILLDKEGQIVNVNMSRPSKPETIKFLKELPGI